MTQLQDSTGTVDRDHRQHPAHISLGADYLINDTTTLRANYIYDYYDDNAYDLLSGGVNMLAIGVSFTL